MGLAARRAGRKAGQREQGQTWALPTCPCVLLNFPSFRWYRRGLPSLRKMCVIQKLFLGPWGATWLFLERQGFQKKGPFSRFRAKLKNMPVSSVRSSEVPFSSLKLGGQPWVRSSDCWLCLVEVHGPRSGQVWQFVSIHVLLMISFLFCFKFESVFLHNHLPTTALSGVSGCCWCWNPSLQFWMFPGHLSLTPMLFWTFLLACPHTASDWAQGPPPPPTPVTRATCLCPQPAFHRSPRPRTASFIVRARPWLFSSAPTWHLGCSVPSSLVFRWKDFYFLRSVLHSISN